MHVEEFLDQIVDVENFFQYIEIPQENIQMNFIVCTLKLIQIDEPVFLRVTKYLGELKQEIQDDIVDTVWDMGSVVARAKKLEDQK